MEDYKFEFEKENPNSLVIRNKSSNKIVKLIACPTITNGCDIIDFFGYNFVKGYNYNFDGIVLITSEEIRKVYYKGLLVATSNKTNGI